MNVVYPNQKVSSAHKMNDKIWARDMAEWVINLARQHNDKTVIKAYLSAANAEISQEKYKYLLAKYENDKDMKDIIAQIRDVDFITPIKEKFMGEFINSYHNYQAYVHDPEVIFRRNQELGEQVYALMMQEATNLLNAQGVDTGQQSKETPDPEKFIEDKLKEWRDTTAKESQHILDYIQDITDSKNKYIEAFYYLFATNQCFTYRRIKDDVIYKEVISPMEYYRIDSGNIFVEDDDFGMCYQKVSFSQIMDEARDILSKENLAYLETLIHTVRNGRTLDVTYELLKSRIWMLDEETNYQSDFRIQFADKHFLVDRYHCVFKTLVKQGILTYINELGETETMIVDETYKKDEDNGDVDLKWEYVNQVWEVWKYGNGAAAIYTKPQPIQVQRELLGNNSYCKLPYNGITWLNRHSKPNPIPYRLLDYLALYRIYTMQQERWVNKFKSWITFPESVLAETDEMTPDERFHQADIDGIFVFNDKLNENPNAMSLIREVATSAVVNFIKILSELREQVKQEAMALASWTPSRDGDINPRQGKAVTEQSLAQSTNAAAWMYSVFNAMRERDYMADLDYSKFAWRDGKQGAYIDPVTNKLVEVNIDGATHTANSYGVMVRNSSKLQEQFQAMKDLAFAAAQGGEFGMAADAIVSDNLFETREIINKHIEATRAFQQQMQAAQDQAMLQAQQMKSESDDRKNQAIIEAERVRAAGNIRVAEISYERELDREAIRLQRDLNGNGFIDKEEAAIASGNEDALSLIEERKLRFQENKEAFNQMDANRNFELNKQKMQQGKKQGKK